MGDAVRDLTHDLCQKGMAMRRMRAKHPSWMCDMTRLLGWILGRRSGCTHMDSLHALGGRAGDAREVFALEAHDGAEHAMVQPPDRARWLKKGEVLLG